MQIINAAVLMATVAVAVPAAANPPRPFGTRYTDHQCKKLHSLPNRDFDRDACIDAGTVGSIFLPYFNTACYLYEQRECKGDTKTIIATIKGNDCLSTADFEWRGVKSFLCKAHHD